MSMKALWKRIEREYAPIARVNGHCNDPACDMPRRGENIVQWAERVMANALL